MPSDQDIRDQLDQLQLLRENMQFFRRQALVHGGLAAAPVATQRGLANAYAEIARCKTVLRGWGVPVEDLPDDVPAASEHASTGSVFQRGAPVPDVAGRDAELEQPTRALRSSQSGRVAASSGLPWIILAVFLVLAGGYALYIVSLNAQDSQRAAAVAIQAGLATPVPPAAAATTKPRPAHPLGLARTPGLTATPQPASTPLPPALSPAPLEFSGSGDQVLADVQLPAAPARAIFSHNGGGNFSVWAYYAGDKRDLLANVIGQYAGSRPLTSSPVSLEITADGVWTLRIEPIELDQAAAGALSGEGDFVSAAFRPDPAGARAYRFTHNGSENFIAQVRCGDDFDIGQNQIGPVDSSAMVELTGSQCYWDVQADGAWTITPGS